MTINVNYFRLYSLECFIRGAMLYLTYLVSLNALLVVAYGEKMAEDEEIIYSYPPPEKYEEYSQKDLRDIETNTNEIPDFPKNFTYEEYSFTMFNWQHKDGIRVSENNTIEELQTAFDPTLETKIVVHGWLSSALSYVVNNTIKEYLSEMDVNAVAVDWSSLAGYKLYPVTTYSVAPVGQGVTALVLKLLEAKVTSLDKVHLIGHSLGAHVMGVAGHRIKKAAGGPVSRITGLDPASPLFEYIGGEPSRLDQSDASFVDIIHTSGGVAGYYGRLGHADFYPNGGVPIQPACKELSLSIIGCSHGMSYRYYDESIRNPKGFKGVRCESWGEYSNGSCSNNSVEYMGDSCSPSARGVFYLETNAEEPYGRG